MADLMKFAREKGVSKEEKTSSSSFHKRRPWLETQQNQTIYPTKPDKTQQETQQNPNSSEAINPTKLDNIPNKTQQELNKSPRKTQQEKPNNTLNKTQQNSTKKELTAELTVEDLFCLSGNRKKIIFSLCEYALENDTHFLSDISYSFLADFTGVKPSSIRTTIRLLKLERLIKVYSPLGGRGATIKIEIDEGVIKNYSKYLNQTKPHKTQQELNNIPNKTLSSSSSLINNEITTTRTLSEEYSTIHIPERLKDVGFRNSHLLQLQSIEHLNVDDIQSSLEQFAFDLENNNVQIRTSAISFLMGILRKQAYVSVSYLEEEKRELELYLKRSERLNEAQIDLIEILSQKSFEEWERGLSESEKREIAPPNDFVEEGSDLQKVMLRNYFMDNIYKK